MGPFPDAFTETFGGVCAVVRSSTRSARAVHVLNSAPFFISTLKHSPEKSKERNVRTMSTKIVIFWGKNDVYDF